MRLSHINSPDSQAPWYCVRVKKCLSDLSVFSSVDSEQSLGGGGTGGGHSLVVVWWWCGGGVVVLALWRRHTHHPNIP